jgi:hypothetical protein
MLWRALWAEGAEAVSLGVLAIVAEPLLLSALPALVAFNALAEVAAARLAALAALAPAVPSALLVVFAEP